MATRKRSTRPFTPHEEALLAEIARRLEDLVPKITERLGRLEGAILGPPQPLGPPPALRGRHLRVVGSKKGGRARL